MNLAVTLFKSGANNEIGAQVNNNNVLNNNSGNSSFKDVLSKRINGDDNKKSKSGKNKNAENIKSKTKNEQVKENSANDENGKLYQKIKQFEENKDIKLENEAKAKNSTVKIKNEKNNVDVLKKQKEKIQEALTQVINQIETALNNKQNTPVKNQENKIHSDFKNKIKDTLTLFKNAKSLKEINAALNELEKLQNNENFKKLMKLLDNNEFSKTTLKSLIEEIPKMIKKFKSIINSLDENNAKVSKTFLDDLKKQSEDVIEKDYQIRFKNRKKVDNGSRHRENSSNSNNNNHEANEDNNSVNNFQNIKYKDNVKGDVNNVAPENQIKVESFSNEISKTFTNNGFAKLPENISKDVLNQVVKNVKIATNGNKKELMINIRPPELGKIRMKLSVEDGKIIAKFGVENEKVLQLLEGNRQALTKQLEDTGLQVEQIDIELQQGGYRENGSEKFVDEFDRIINNGNYTGTNENEADDTYMNETYMENIAMRDYFATNVSFTV